MAPAAHRGILRYISPSHTHTHSLYDSLLNSFVDNSAHVITHTHTDG